MTLDLMPPTRPLSLWGRYGDKRAIVPHSRKLERYPEWTTLLRTVYGLGQLWPEAASAMSQIKVVRGIKSPTVAETRVLDMVTVSAEIRVGAWAVKHPNLDSTLLGWGLTRQSVGTTFADVLVHEFGHVVSLLSISCRYPGNVARGMAELTERIEERCGVSWLEAGAQLSDRAQVNQMEAIAEAFVAEHKFGAEAHPFALSTVEVLRELWPSRRPGMLPGWVL